MKREREKDRKERKERKYRQLESLIVLDEDGVKMIVGKLRDDRVKKKWKS